MAKKKNQRRGIAGWQHLEPGDVITVIERGDPVKCRVLFCILEGEERFHAHLEVIEGERKCERFTTVIVAGAPDEAPGATSAE